MTDTRPKTRLVVVGGGTAGWITAAATAKLLGHAVDVRLIESDAIGTVGVGEATIPQIRRLNEILGIDEAEFVRATRGSFKLGIEFRDWGRIGERYLHSFGEVGMPLGRVPFHHYWLRRALSGAGDAGELMDHSLHAHAADRGAFGVMPRVGQTRMAGLAYAYHFDSGLYARFLRGYAEARGVRRTEGRLAQIERHAGTGEVAAVLMEDGERIAGDLFVDCTGFRALLLGQALGVRYEDWSHWLPCDRAVAVPSERLAALPPYTRATAHGAGWQWRIPLQHRTGNGHVYCSRYVSEDEATQTLLSGLEGEPVGEPRLLSFKAGRRETFWDRNVVAIGLSSGFLEPLESTSIHLIQSHVNRLIQLFPHGLGAGGRIEPADRDEYNHQCGAEIDQVRDFLILHYHRTDRDDTPFWRHCKDMPVPERLARAMALFEASGRICREPDDLFREASWLMVMAGQGLRPRGYAPMADAIGDDQLAEFLANVRALVEQEAAKLPSHDAFIERACRA